ncbi:MAG: FixH family protein [Chitinophagales bacterium]|nr:FixH family protein [Chitinophagales bacterium]
MKKFNWGWGITLLYTGFAIMMLGLAYKTTTVKDDLVTPDYYARELKFQEMLDKQKRASQLPEKLAWQVNGKQVLIKFPKIGSAEKAKAEILFYNTAEAKNDFKVNCAADSAGVCELDVKNLAHGVYQMQIDWSAGGSTYYNEGTINIQ